MFKKRYGGTSENFHTVRTPFVQTQSGSLPTEALATTTLPQVSLTRRLLHAAPTPSQNPRLAEGLAGSWLEMQTRENRPTARGHPGAWPQKPGPANSISTPGATHHSWNSAGWGCARKP